MGRGMLILRIAVHAEHWLASRHGSLSDDPGNGMKSGNCLLSGVFFSFLYFGVMGFTFLTREG